MAEIDVKDFDRAMGVSMANRRRQGLRCGPAYSHPGESAPLVWWDQVFERELAPAGIVECGQALRVGATQNSLDVILVASHANEGPVVAAAGATVTFTLLQADAMDGEFQEVGPTICVKAPADGISAEPCMEFFRAALGNFRKPWLKIRLEFTGEITGGLVDCCLGYAPR